VGTHYGKLLSERLKWPFIDTDQLILQLHSYSSIRDLYRAMGEKGFRELERKAIEQSAPSPSSVIAVGGGAVLNQKSVVHLQTLGRLIYLKASFETIRSRIFQSGIPSFLDEKNPLESLRQTYQRRVSLYESIPSICVDVDSSQDEQILTQLIEIANGF
jgi:shikimate kinase